MSDEYHRERVTAAAALVGVGGATFVALWSVASATASATTIVAPAA